MTITVNLALNDEAQTQDYTKVDRTVLNTFHTFI